MAGPPLRSSGPSGQSPPARSALVQSRRGSAGAPSASAPVLGPSDAPHAPPPSPWRRGGLALALLSSAACSPPSPKLPSADAFASNTAPPVDSTAWGDHTGTPTPECAPTTCAGCCDEHDTCQDVLTDSTCARSGDTCRDCTTDARACAPDAVCVIPDTLAGGQVDDSALRLGTVDAAHRTRSDLRTRIFGSDALPTLAPVRESSDAADPFGVVDPLDAPVAVEQLTFELPGGTTTDLWVLTPETPSGALVVVHQGHWHTLHEGRLETVAAAALGEGATVVGLTMPLYGTSTGPVLTHDDLIDRFPDDLPGHGVQVFLAPVAAAIDAVAARQAIDHITLVGISGGGWTALMYAALDPRVDRSVSIAGGEPLYQREGTDWGDREQHDTHLYEVAGYLDLALLAALEPGRQQVQVVHRYDTCCFAGTGYQDWEPTVRGGLQALGGGELWVFLDESIRGHEVSPHTLAALVSPLLAGDSVRYFDDTLPGDRTFATTGTWERDASTGFGGDAARGSAGAATWTIELPAGPWTAGLTWAADPALSDTVEVTVSVDGLATPLVVDQTRAPADLDAAETTWTELATGHADTPTTLTVTLAVPPGGDVRADALRVEAPWTP